MFFSTTKVQLVAYWYFACKIATGMWFLHTHPHFGPEMTGIYLQRSKRNQKYSRNYENDHITLLRNDMCIPQLWPVNEENEGLKHQSFGLFQFFQTDPYLSQFYMGCHRVYGRYWQLPIGTSSIWCVLRRVAGWLLGVAGMTMKLVMTGIIPENSRRKTQQ